MALQLFHLFYNFAFLNVLTFKYFNKITIGKEDRRLRRRKTIETCTTERSTCNYM